MPTFVANCTTMYEQEFLNLLLENIQFQLRHPHYQRTLDVRKFCQMIITGEGQDDEVTRARRFESEPLKSQRIRLYNPITKYVLARPRKYWKRLGSVEGIRRKETAPDENAVMELRDAFHRFMPGQTLEMWLNEKLEYLGVTDPNAWIVYERRDKRDVQGMITETTVYPWIVSCSDAVNFSYEYGELKWFLARTMVMETVVANGVRKDRMLENYYLYAPGIIVRAREIGDNTVREAGEEIQTVEVYPAAPEKGWDESAPPVYFGEKKARNFYIKIIENDTTEVPACIAGAYFDEKTMQQSRVPWFDPAEHILKDLIRDKSALDVTKTVHTYPRRYEFVKPCRFTDENGNVCVRGYLNDMRTHDNICPACHGSGKAANFSTEQEVLQFVMPDALEDMVELSKLAFTETIDTAFVDFLVRQIELGEKRTMAAVFDSGLYQAPDQTQTRTATEIDAVMTGISDVLQPFARQISLHYELAYRVGAQYRNIAGFEVDHSYPDELDIATVSELVESFGQIKEKGVGYEVLAAQRKRIQEKTFEGNPEEQQWIAARYAWLPFDDKSPEDVAMILAARSPLDDARVLRENWLEIFREIREETPAFPAMAYAMQKQIVDTKVQEFKGRILLIDAPDPEPMAGANDDTNAEPGAVTE